MAQTVTVAAGKRVNHKGVTYEAGDTFNVPDAVATELVDIGLVNADITAMEAGDAATAVDADAEGFYVGAKGQTKGDLISPYVSPLDTRRAATASPS